VSEPLVFFLEPATRLIREVNFLGSLSKSVRSIERKIVTKIITQ
jgi:hypothetical protein